MTSLPRPEPARGRPAVDTIAGLMASAALFLGAIAVVHRPARLAPAAILIALLAGAMSRRWGRLAGVALAVAGVGWLLGMAIAVLTNHPLW